MVQQSKVVSDLVADGNEVDSLVSNLDEAGWQTPTPAPGWTIAHQVAHLAATFRLAALAASNAGMFKDVTSRLSPDFGANVKAAMAEYLAEPPDVLLRRWRAERAGVEQALSALPGDQMVPWLVRPLPAAVLAAAGMMELFAHGQDIADGLGVRRTHTDRIGHLVAFGVRTWDFGYQARGMQTPDVEFRFELVAPSGTVWAFGPEDAEQRVTGPAVDFCLLVTRRRHHADLGVKATGADAERWLDIAQAYRGPAGEGRRPGQFPAQ
ncbi:TIGR03084 family metal-binding protein [Micromonospora sp. RHAY321]|uniref:TIGR03084 family metal-binding protein n=1 Tax=unclassified Micromonospora TaxID=2617518 RepID=UPI00207C1C9F|nr:TIGR03084 family metal-binding protein [Micromonospora sp. RHAY321]MCO1597549.1 TIGR03084 family metal-binding protein [Micromonospora sp. RHAY321]